MLLLSKKSYFTMIDLNALKKRVYDVVGAIYDVHSVLGPGLNESCYQEGMELELKEKKIPFVREMTFHPHYRGVPMEATFRVDFICKDDIIVECKAVSDVTGAHRAQLFNYMRLLQMQCGVLVNFYPTSALVERYFYDKKTNQIISTDGHVIYNYNQKR